MNDDFKLNPCLHCGGKGVMLAPNMHRITCVVCKKCGASSKYGTPEETASAWNLRTPLPDNKALTCEGCRRAEAYPSMYPCNMCRRNEDMISDCYAEED